MNYRKRIKEKGLKITWIAKKLGISQPMMSLCLKGERSFTFESKSKLKELLK